MPEINKCGAGGALFALVGVILAIFAISLPEFVQVFLITDEDQIGDDTLIAGVGIFNSEYDATVVDPALVAASGIPNEKFSTPSLEFPLLFPAQENFVVDVLPVNSNLADQLSGSLPQPTVDDLLASVKVVEDLQFESCEQYIPAADAATIGVFAELQTNTLPVAVQGVTALIVGQLGTAVPATISLVNGSDTNVARGFLFTILNQTVNALAATDGDCAGVTVEVPVDADTTGACIFGALNQSLPAFAGKALSTAAVNGLMNHFISGQCDVANGGSPLSVLQCFGAIGFELTDTSLIVPAELNGVLGNFCTLIDPVCDDGTTTKGEYLGLIAGLLTEIGGEDALSGATAIALYLESANPTFGDLGVSALVPTAEVVVTNPTVAADNDFPALFTTDYKPCIVLKLFQEATGTNLSLTGDGALCVFGEYWPGAAKLLVLDQSNPLAPTTALLADLYGRCFGASEAAGFPTGICPGIFGRTVLGGALSSDAPLNPPEAFQPAAIADCEDTVTDNEKITTAQALVVISVCCHVLAFLGGVAGVLMEAMPVIYGVSAFTAVAAAVFIISALLTVRSAPVYENVGEPPAGDVPEPFFKEGSVVIISEIAALMMLISAGCFSAAVYQLMKAEPSEDEDISAAEVKAKEKEEPVPTKAAEEAPEAEETPEAKNSDIVPGTDTSI